MRSRPQLHNPKSRQRKSIGTDGSTLPQRKLTSRPLSVMSPSEISEEAPAAACAADPTATASHLELTFTHDGSYLSGIFPPPNTPVLTSNPSSAAATAELQPLEPLDPADCITDVTHVNQLPGHPPRPETDTKMVQLTEVVDEHFQENQPGPDEEEDDFTDTGMPPTLPRSDCRIAIVCVGLRACHCT